MNHPWQQPIRPMEYSIINPELGQRDVEYSPFWYRVMFIRVTDEGYEIIGEHGSRWDSRAIIIRDVK